MRKSSTDSVRTPPAILKALRKEFGKFYDPVPYNPKFNPLKHKDALTTEWGKVNYINPPFSKTKQFLQKTHEQWKKNKTCIILLKTDVAGTIYFTEFAKGAEIRFIQSPIKFPGYSRPAPFTTMLLVFRAGKRSAKWKTVTYK
jgi:hypothetical protein